jgi:glucoamylase
LREPSLDIWEEELGHHYFTLRVSAAALEEGAQWLRASGDSAAAAALEREERAIRALLDGYWDERAGFYRSRSLPGDAVSAKLLDTAVILATIHADSAAEVAHSARDPRMHATLERLAQLFDRLYAINRARPAARAPAMGRYEGDVYFSGGAYYFSTLAAAELCFRAAAAVAPNGGDSLAWCSRGDAYLETVRAFTPPSGDLSEQFDQRTGEQTSAKHLAWSYAAFISCVAARRAVSLR